MANDLDNPRVLRLDTAATVDATRKFKIRAIHHKSVDAADATLQNGAGQEIWQGIFGAGGGSVWCNLPDGFECTGLIFVGADPGVVHVYSY